MGQITETTTINARVFTSDGRAGPQRSATYTRVQPINPVTTPPPAAQCATPVFNKTSGTWGSGTVNGYLSCSTAGATLYQNGSVIAAGANLSIPLNGSIDVYGTKSGMTDSGTATYTNNYVASGGGGGRLDP